MKSYFIGLDNGGTSCKAVLFDSKGNEICQAGRMLEMETPRPLFTERDMETLFEKNKECLREVITESSVNPGLIKGISFCGHGKGLYLWGKDNKPVRKGIVSTDGRAHSYVKRWEEDGTADKVFNCNYQKVLACQPVALLKWIKTHEPANYRKIRWVFEVKDYIRFRLTGKAYAELTDYSGSNLLDLSKMKFSRELLKLFGIEEIYDALPPLKKSTDICGYITKEVSESTGLPEGIPAAGGMFDIDACSIAMNIINSENLCVIAGTWSINEFISKTPILNRSIMMNSCYCLGDYYLVEECSPTSAGNLEWFIGMFMQQEINESGALGKSIYQYCDELTASIAPEDQDIIFLPYIYGSNYNASSKACFLGLDSHHSRAHVVRAVFEGIVFCHMVHIEKLLKNKSDFNSIRLAGGAANSAVWSQMFADVTGFPIETVQVKELGALGCAMAAAVACGEYSDLEHSSTAMSRVGEIVYPGEDASTYRKKFERYKDASQSLERFW